MPQPATNYRAIAEQAARRYLPAALADDFLRQLNAESHFQPGAVSPAGARWIGQFMPATARAYGVHDDVSSIFGAAKYDADLLHRYGTFARALSAYNSGRPDAYLDPGFAHGQTFDYVRQILGNGAATSAAGTPHTTSAAPPTPAAPAPGGGGFDALSSLAAVLASSNRLVGLPALPASTWANTSGGTGPLTPSFSAPAGPSTAPSPRGSAPSARPSVSLRTLGKSTARLAPSFVNSLYTAAKAQGATQIRFISTDRPAAVNADVGGVPHSNHIPDNNGFAHAADGEAFVPGRGWVPLGTLLRPVANKYGLRSGDVPGFYHGGPDPNHVDDGHNHGR